MSAFRGRKEGRVLTPAERAAEREYEARRRKRRVQVMLATEEEVAAWRRAAREAGFRTTGEWVYGIVLRQMGVGRPEELNVWRERAMAAERDRVRLERRVAVLEAVSPEMTYRLGS